MNKKKKFLIIVLVLAVLGGISAAAVTAVRRMNAKVIPVIPMESLAMDYYFMDENNNISGEVTTSATQKVQLDNEAIVDEIYVKVGDKVRAGDKLMSYDTTLTEMELELEKLTKESNERKLKKAEKRLQSLENGGPIEDEDYEDTDWHRDSDLDDSPDDAAGIERPSPGTSGVMAVGSFRPLRALAGEEVTGTEPENPSSETTPEETPSETPTETPAQPSETPEVTPTETPQPDKGTAYSILDYDSQPYKGSGTVEDPFRFLCSSQEEYIVAKGSFLNKMAGYDRDGKEKVDESAPFWYRLEFHEEDTIADPENPEVSLVGYYTRKGGKDPADPQSEKHFPVDDAMLSADDTTVLTPTPTPEPEEDLGDDDWDDWEEEEGGEGPSREDAIKAQKRSINNLKLQIKANALEISKLEKKVKNQTILASIDGTVTVVGDPVTGESEGTGFIEVESDGGLYVKGSIGELVLDQFMVGQVLSGIVYSSNTEIEVEIREISQFPADEANQYYNGMGNPNVSYYSFLAAVTTQDLELTEGEEVAIKMPVSVASDNSIYVDAAFIRNENGVYYAFKEEDGKLKKQIVKASKSFDGYTVVITSGLTMKDKIAFPYGKGVEEGAPTKEGSLDELYGFY